MESSAPTATLSTRNCTPTTPTLSEAVADKLTTPDTDPDGADTLTEGAVTSAPVTESTRSTRSFKSVT